MTVARRVPPLCSAVGLLGFAALGGVLAWAVAACGAAAPAVAAPAVTYYVSPAGNDHWAGTSRRRAWRTLARVDRARLVPGDRVLLEGSATFAGTLRVVVAGAGSPRRPVLVSAYGRGNARIEAGSGSGVEILDSGGVRVRRLTLVGDGASVNDGSGLLVENALPHARRLRTIGIEDVLAEGFGYAGIAVYGKPADGSQSGFAEVTIRDCVAHDNRFYGVYVSGVEDPTTSAYANANVTISGCRAYRNLGDPDYPRSHSGDGIFLGDVDHGLITRSVAYENGALNSCAGCGPVGIWTANANDVTIEHSESFDNHSGPGGHDGDGFDMDGGSTDCVLQYDYSHDNDGAGFVIFDYQGAPHRVSGDVIRYDLSEDDSRRGGYPGVLLGQDGGSVRESQVYDNTVKLDPPPGGTPAAVEVLGAEDARFSGNLLVTSGGLPLVNVPSAQPGVVFEGNDYWSSGAPLLIDYNGASYGSLASWAAATGQEMEGGREVGQTLEPSRSLAGLAGRAVGLG